MNKPPREGAPPDAVGRVPSETGNEDVPLQRKSAQADENAGENCRGSERKEGEERPTQSQTEDMNLGASASEKDPKTRSEGFEKWERDQMRWRPCWGS